MRVYLLPLTTNRTLLYCQRLGVPATGKQSLADKITTRAAKIWNGWEKKEGGWQKKVVNYGNYALRRIPYEEWGLKSVPPVSARKKDLELKGNKQVELVFPPSIIPTQKAESLVMRLATERDALHRKRLRWCLVGMPITIPFALVPIIPNLPFFYLVYRAWSHWRALAGGDHLEFLVKNKLFKLSPSKLLDDIYNPLLPDGAEKMTIKPIEQTGPLEKEPEVAADEVITLTQENGEDIAEALELPELEVELERAIWQINQAKNAKIQEVEEKRRADAQPDKPRKDEKS